MSVFEAAAELGVFPSGVVFGILSGLISLPVGYVLRHIRRRAAVFIADMLSVLMFSFCLFSLGVGMEGHLRYPVFFGTLIGFAAVRCIEALLCRKKCPCTNK